MSDGLNWKPIDTAPKDGRPVWVRGWDWGNENKERHYGWVFWDDRVDEWREGFSGENTRGSMMQYLTDWLAPVDNSGGT